MSIKREREREIEVEIERETERERNPYSKIIFCLLEGRLKRSIKPERKKSTGENKGRTRT
jgi:hypothetical protein